CSGGGKLVEQPPARSTCYRGEPDWRRRTRGDLDRGQPAWSDAHRRPLRRADPLARRLRSTQTWRHPDPMSAQDPQPMPRVPNPAAPPSEGASRLGGEPAGMRNRVAWGLVAVMAVVLVGGIGALLVPLRPYLIAKYRGQGADLRETRLTSAPLRAANLG